MPPRQRLPGVVLDSHVAEALVERVDRDSETVSAPSTVTHEGFEPVASIVEDEPVAHRAKPGRDVAGLTHSLLRGRDVPAPPVEIAQRRSISAGPAGAVGIHREGRGCALSLLGVIDARRVVALPVQVSLVADDGTLLRRGESPCCASCRTGTRTPARPPTTSIRTVTRDGCARGYENFSSRT